MTKANYIMIGGFLGAGKTTAVLKFASHLRDAGKRVGLITNDQSFGLVDTTMLSGAGFDVEEISGGCFCCKFNSLVDASNNLSRETRPEVFLAEPVGSCTDLRAAVNYPLQRIYGDDFRVAPLSVLVDPVRALRVLGVESGKNFSRKVLYVYSKQLEEAEIIVINKSDLLEPERLAVLQEELGKRFPARQFVTSARNGHGLQAWFDYVLDQQQNSAAPPDLDYDLYAEGEALLGWLNLSARVNPTGDELFDGNEFLETLAENARQAHRRRSLEIAHLKMTLSPLELASDLAVLNVVRTDAKGEFSHTLKGPVGGAELLVNLRAEGAPETVKEIVEEALAESAKGLGLEVNEQHLEHFSPARPEPTYRMNAG